MALGHFDQARHFIPVSEKECALIETRVKRCAGLDVHKMTGVATVLIEDEAGEVHEETCTFGTFRRDRQG